MSSVQVPLLKPASLVQLPKGQAFALLEGGQLWKLRIPLPDTAHDSLMQENIAQISRYMEKPSRMEEPCGGSCNAEKRPYFMAERQRNHGETDR
ncbi:hypothetical protein [Klebsiella oxytoca]|uniref:hypothetical protein n=1 Tax=Klebsiella oxytoca TaxID=571 RepID=UPI0035282CCE